MRNVNFSICFVCWAMLLLMAGSVEAAKFYVSPKGDDAWSGRLSGPNSGRTDGPLATGTGALITFRQHHHRLVDPRCSGRPDQLLAVARCGRDVILKCLVAWGNSHGMHTACHVL